jgi:predicted esterase
VPPDPIPFATDDVFSLESALSTYWIYVPESYDESHQTPTTLFVWLHGCGGQGEFDIYTVSPGGDQDWISIAVGGREGGCWDPGGDGTLVKAAIADVKRHFNVDPQRVILGGYSSGGDLAYRTAFYDAGAFAGVLAENTAPFRDTGSSQAASLAAASWKFNVVHLAHLQDTTYPIATVRAETDAMLAAGFPITRIERPGTHYDDPGTDADLVALLLPYIDDGWRSP